MKNMDRENTNLKEKVMDALRMLVNGKQSFTPGENWIAHYRVRIEKDKVEQLRHKIDELRNTDPGKTGNMLRYYRDLVVTDEGWVGFYDPETNRVYFDVDMPPKYSHELSEFLAREGAQGMITYEDPKRHRVIHEGIGRIDVSKISGLVGEYANKEEGDIGMEI